MSHSGTRVTADRLSRSESLRGNQTITFHNEGEACIALTTGTATPEDLREIVTSYPLLRAPVAAYPAIEAALSAPSRASTTTPM